MQADSKLKNLSCYATCILTPRINPVTLFNFEYNDYFKYLIILPKLFNLDVF